MAPRLFVPAPTTSPARYGLVTAADQVVPEDPAKFRLGIEWQQLPPADRVKVVELEQCASSPPVEFDGPFGSKRRDLFLGVAGFPQKLIFAHTELLFQQQLPILLATGCQR